VKTNKKGQNRKVGDVKERSVRLARQRKMSEV
jgi:hypothetical protein